MLKVRSSSSTHSALRAESIPAKLFVFQNMEPCDHRQVTENDAVIADAVFYRHDITGVLMYTEFTDSIAPELILHALSFLASYAVRTFHQDTIFTYTKDQRLKAILPHALFYPKGDIYIRKVEPWRFLIPDTCFDEEGYIINQGQMGKLPFGLFSTRENGCGWIAAYNLLKLNGKEKTMEEVNRGLSRWGLFGEVFGENLFQLAFYLKRQSLPVHLAFGKKAVIRAMEHSRSGILLYSRGKGSHYSAYRVRKDRTCYFFNAHYGRSFHKASPREFLDANLKGIKTMLIYVNEPLNL